MSELAIIVTVFISGVVFTVCAIPSPYKIANAYCEPIKDRAEYAKCRTDLLEKGK